MYEEPFLLRNRRKMIQHNIMVQMLMERTVLADIQLNRSDRIWDQNGEGNDIPQNVRRFMSLNQDTVSALSTFLSNVKVIMCIPHQRHLSLDWQG